MTRTSLSLLLLAFACSGTRLPRGPSGPEVLEVRGGVKGAPFHLGEADLATLEQGKARGVAPGSPREAVYQGVDLAALKDRLELSAGTDTLVVRTADRRAIPIPLAVVLQLHPILASRADGAPVAGRRVAWPNVEHHGLTSDPRAALWWAHDVVALEYVSWARTYGRALRLPEGAPAGARAGAGVYGSRCLECHRLRKAGGTNGPELVRGEQAPSAERLTAVLPGHPGWSSAGTEPARPEVVSQLAAFLFTVARTPPPEEEPPEAEPAREGPPEPPLTPPR